MPAEKMNARLVDDWEQLPAGWSHPDVVDVDIDAHGRAFVFNRGEHPVIVYDRDGSFVTSWGEGLFTHPHSLTFGPDGTVYCTDDFDHTLRRFTPEGELLMMIGTPGVPGDSRVDDSENHRLDMMSTAVPKERKHAGSPFNGVTDCAILSDGQIYVSDGYGNARVHVFDLDGNHEFSWGEAGEAPGEFTLPHGIAASPDEQHLYVADRENSRIQIFDRNGKFVDLIAGVNRPCALAFGPDELLYVAELGMRAGLGPWITSTGPDAPGGSCSVWTATGEMLSRWGSPDPAAAGSFFAPHGIAVDANGDVYVGEVTWSAGGRTGAVPADCHTLQKFTWA
ncbi:peptidyl-alpha-hydroxyglycine alpha-amidating lyase family protein [Cumulibacter soli]|uniref:peptidyl-alpha-hydroxyglycine alpha-amidating lyase family protein n=1 Tax=Cumulibacter soli TaxID=2546344 RepID=UPI001ABA0BBD|nr:peptidyl-alpha-hydroxyglycine alpha-amidating lyase family protein [Cumulibacter soli]